MRDKRFLKPLFMLSIVVLCTACGPLGLPAAEPSPTHVPARASHAVTQTAPVILPTGTSTPVPAFPTPIFEILVDNVATGPQGELYATGFGASGSDLRRFAQWQGTNWTGLGGGLQTAGNAMAVDSLGHLHTDSLKESDQGLATAMIRWEGARWEDITGNFTTAVDALKAGRISSNIPVMALAVDEEDRLYAAGSFYTLSADGTEELPMGYVAKWDRETWTVLGPGFDRVNLLALAAGPSGKLYVSGEQPRISAGEYRLAGFIAEWDGKTWTQIGTGSLNSCLSIRRLAIDPTGGLYASCTWSEPGELVFHWDGTDWITITDRLEGEAPAIFGMAVDENGRLYIGGSFDSVNGVPARYVAYWDGSLWHALGNGVNRPVNAIAVAPGGDLYIVGAFTEAGDLPVQYVARWDGGSWHVPGP